MDFNRRYENLNKAQREAVDTIDGPVMVIAGPGTGKTELLSVRAANILKKTDALPENILCLTFTDSGANAMRERLTDIIGKEAYKVAIHTFHSFGSEIINQNGQYFYRGANFRPSDELSSYEIIRSIFDQLDYNNPLASKMNGEYTHLSNSLTVISELKKSGLTSDELLAILDDNDAVIEKAEQLLSPIFAEKISKNTAIKASEHIEAIRNSSNGTSQPAVVPLSTVLADSLAEAVATSIESNSTKAITAWRNAWFKKDTVGHFILKSHERQIKLRAVSYIYERYLSKMQEAGLYDFDDMILRVVHAMEIFDDLRFNLQEKYQYIMVDEFQDTNMAQMRILHNLTNNEIQGDTPNILVVGDDDQAIYSFQGADISNILNFRQNYPKAKLITLTENYRSAPNILERSRDIITQGLDRLENRIKDLNKQLTAHNSADGDSVFMHEAETAASERTFIVESIKQKINSGVLPKDIAVLTRHHREIESLLPYFYSTGINVSYEKRDNVLDQEPIILIEKLAKVLIAIAKGKHDDINALLPEMLAHKAWGIEPITFWKLSLKAYDNHTRWMEIMATTPELAELYGWLISTALDSVNEPLEKILDILVGKIDTDAEAKSYVSPIYNYFFSKDKLEKDPENYLSHIEALRTIRAKLRDYSQGKEATLETFVDFIALNRKLGNVISSTRKVSQDEDAINIMTAHKSKGLEFDTVYVVNAVDNVWGESARSRNRLINYPENLPLAPAGESDDERLRLFYVAITRAKKQLHISYSLQNDSNKKTLRAAFLLGDEFKPEKITSSESTEQDTKTAELAWYEPIIKPLTTDMHKLLAPTLENYKLSITHLNNFLDITKGGPAAFLTQNLLRFPQAKSANASFGTAIHETLQQAHNNFVITGKKQPIEDIVANFENILKSQYLEKHDHEVYLQRGGDALRAYLEKHYDDFSANDQTELNFANQSSIVDSATLTGKLDLVNIDRKNHLMSVTDYKTGKPAKNWTGKDDFEKIKLHKYRQQLLFYKLLVENSRDYHDFKVREGTMQFVEPTTTGEEISLGLSFDGEDLSDFIKLISAVYSHIKVLDLPDISKYESSFKGVLAFEQDLINNLI